MNADEMFEELGYENIINECCMCEYVKYFKLKGARHIVFAIDKTISVCEENKKFLAVNRDYFTMQELQAINKKVEELRMDIEEDIKILDYTLDNLIEHYKNKKEVTATEIVATKQPTILMFLNILKEREQDKARLKELEKENETLKNFTSDIFNEDITTEYISKQKIQDKIDELEEKAKRIGGTYQYADSEEDLIEKKNRVIQLRTVAEILQELL